MEIIITHKSALEYWRLQRRSPNMVKTNGAEKLRRKNLPKTLPRITNICRRMPTELSYPINLMVGSKNAQWKSKTVRQRLYTGRIPDGGFVGIGSEMAVSAPHFCFFQMAGELPLIKLIELGFEICGTYSLPPISSHGNEYSAKQDNGQSNDDDIPEKLLRANKEFINNPKLYSLLKETADRALRGEEEDIENRPLYGLPQLTNTKAIKAFTAKMEGVKGKKKAARALRYIADGSASPMVTILFMLLTLPYKLGGYGLPAPELNRRIDIVSPTKDRPGKSYYVCDLFWPEEGLAVEYDSDTYHSGADRIARDSKRRFDLSALGISIITVTNKQIRNAAEFEGVAKLIAQKLNKQLQYKNPQFQKAKRELRRLLLLHTPDDAR